MASSPESVKNEGDVMFSLMLVHSKSGVTLAYQKEKDGSSRGSRQAKEYPAILDRANYLAPDRPDAQDAVKELLRRMARPTKVDSLNLKKLVRCFIGKPRLVVMYPWRRRKTALMGCSLRRSLLK